MKYYVIEHHEYDGDNLSEYDSKDEATEAILYQLPKNRSGRKFREELEYFTLIEGKEIPLEGLIE